MASWLWINQLKLSPFLSLVFSLFPLLFFNWKGKNQINIFLDFPTSSRWFSGLRFSLSGTALECSTSPSSQPAKSASFLFENLKISQQNPLPSVFVLLRFASITWGSSLHWLYWIAWTVENCFVQLRREVKVKELEFKRAIMVVDSGSGVDLRSKSVKLSAVLGFRRGVVMLDVLMNGKIWFWEWAMRKLVFRLGFSFVF